MRLFARQVLGVPVDEGAVPPAVGIGQRHGIRVGQLRVDGVLAVGPPDVALNGLCVVMSSDGQTRNPASSWNFPMPYLGTG